MIKKVNMFFDKGLRRRADADVEFIASKGYASAMELVKMVLSVGSYPRVCPPKELDLGGSLVKFFDGMHAESDHLSNAVKKTIRLQVVFFLIFGDIIKIKLSFFGKGKEQIFELETSFQEKDGVIAGGIGYGITTK